MNELEKELQTLEQSAQHNSGLYRQAIDAAKEPNFMQGILERFPNPISNELGADGHIDIVAPEFTCLCPITGQPDFAQIRVKYVPDEWCVESKSFKLYIMSFRQYRGFHEAVTNKILMDLVKLLEPKYISVHGVFTPRGGIAFQPLLVWEKKEAPVDL